LRSENTLDNVASADICTLPPENHTESDGDSDDEDSPKDINHLSKAQLSTEAEVKIVTADGTLQTINGGDDGDIDNDGDCNENDANKDATDDDDDDDDDDAEPFTPNSSENRGSVKRKQSVAISTKKKTFSSCKRMWQKQDLTCDDDDETASRPTGFDLETTWNPAELFELFLDDDVLTVIVQHCITYAKAAGNHSFELNNNELRLFLALLLLSGYAILPRRRTYWERLPDVQNEAFKRAICRATDLKKFCVIFMWLTIVISIWQSATTAIAQLNERWLLYAPGDGNLSIDEAMIPYYGRHGAKQHLHGKPIRFGFKVWSLTTSGGYMVHWTIYSSENRGTVKRKQSLAISTKKKKISSCKRIWQKQDLTCDGSGPGPDRPV